jgi:hypothetical protein
MGTWSSRYRDVGQEAYNINNHGDINVSSFQTGDLIFFSKDFPSSGLHRLTRRIRGKLWHSVGVVIKAPDVFPNQTLLLECASMHPDDHLLDRMQLKTIESGVRVISLSDRLKSQDGVQPAAGIRKRGRPFGDAEATLVWETFDAYNQWSTMDKLRPIIDQEKITDSQSIALQALKDLRIVFAPYVKLDFNELAGRALNRYCNEPLKYNKIEVYAWPSEKDLKKQAVRVNE